EAVAYYFGLIGSPSERFEYAYAAWAAWRATARPKAFSDAFVQVLDTDGDGQPDLFVTVANPLERSSQLANFLPFLKGENDKTLQEISRVRRAHQFPHAASDNISGDLYPPDNDLGVAACLHGDFDRANDFFVSASNLDNKPGLLVRRLATGARRTRVSGVKSLDSWTL